MKVNNGVKQTEIGLIPEDWEIAKLGDVMEEVNIRVKDLDTIDAEQIPILSLTKNYGLIPQSQRFQKRIATEDVSNYKVIKKWQVVYNPYVIWEGAIHTLRKMDIGIVSPVYIVWEFKDNVDPSFMDYLLRTPLLLNSYLSRASGVVNRRRSISKTDFQNIPIPLPPLSEQQKIAKVLDTIQQAIEIQNRIIETTKNLKKSLMQKLFTEGTKEEELKETEIGLIPKSWEVVRLGERIEFTRKPRNLRIGSNDEIPFIPMEFISDSQKYANWHIKKYSEISSGTFVFKGDIILAKITPCFENGKQALLNNLPMDFGYATTEVFAFHSKDKGLLKEFIFEYLRIPKIRKEMTSKMEGTTGRKRLPRNALENLLIPLPPLPEQQEIANILSIIDRKIEIEQRRKDLLKQLFKTMLNKLMSGEIRLKEVEI